MTNTITAVCEMIDSFDKKYTQDFYKPEGLLDSILAVYAARKQSLLNGNMDNYEQLTLELGVLRKIILEKMYGGDANV